VKRREQLLNLLVNKFRGKYISSVVSDESNVDRIIRTEVTRFLEHEQMTEGNLVKLDQRLGELLENGAASRSPGSMGGRRWSHVAGRTRCTRQLTIIAAAARAA
jgi:hypothetical protein